VGIFRYLLRRLRLLDQPYEQASGAGHRLEQTAPAPLASTRQSEQRRAPEAIQSGRTAHLNPAQVKDEFRSHPRRALVVTTVVHESRSVKAFLTDPAIVVGEKGSLYEFGRFCDPAGDWLIIHAFSAQGNTDASLVVSKAHQEFGSFHAQMFVGVAGSLKADIPIGSVVVGDYVYNGHSAKVEDTETLVRPHSLAPARELLTASQGIIYSNEWIDLIRAPAGMTLPSHTDYPCDFPPLAAIKGIVSGEEVVAGGKSHRFALLRSHFNDCGAVEMEGWGAMNAAHHENTPAIVVRGISDMCAGKDHASDKLHQPIAAAHAAAFAFGILSFRSKVRTTEGLIVGGDPRPSALTQGNDAPPSAERRVEFVFNFEGSRDDWPEEKINAVADRLKRAIDDDQLKVIRVDLGSVRLVMSVRESDLATMDLAKLRGAASESGVTLLGAVTMERVAEAEAAKAALEESSVDLLSWEKTLPNGRWMARPEQGSIEDRFQLQASVTVLLGEPGSGKSALLSKIAADLLKVGAPVFAIKADLLPTEVVTESDLQHELRLPAPPTQLILRLAALEPIYVLIDQLDALASQLDLRSGRLNVLLNLVRRVGSEPNVHILLSARTFEFNHDVRLRAIEAEAVTLALPPWHEVKEQLAEIGVDPDAWPEKARDVMRIPQALKTYISLASSGSTAPFNTYQAMLEQFWKDRVASAGDSAELIALASDLAGQMAEEESLWLAAARFDDRLASLRRLEALGLIVRSENSLRVAFSHQTLFDYVLARTFVRTAGLLSVYVLERQDSLFVRAKVWSALNYLRGAEVGSYEREFLSIWNTTNLRRHLRLLLIEFLGQVAQPLDFETVCMAEALNSSDLRVFGLKSIGSSPGWFPHFASTAIRSAMSGTDAEASQASRVLGHAWRAHRERVVQLIRECWLPHPERDTYSWMTIQECAHWTAEVEDIAFTVLRRTAVAAWHVSHAAATLAVDQPDVALRLIRAKFDFLLSEVKGRRDPPPFPSDGSEAEKTAWYVRHDGTRPLKDLLESAEWDEIPTLAEAAPAAFVQICWPWYVSVFTEIIALKDDEGVGHIYPGRYVLEMDFVSPETRPASRETPLLSAIQIAIKELAEKAQEQFVKWADANSNLEVLAVQQLIAHGYEAAADQLASRALDWLLLDERRFQLGTAYRHRLTTIDLVRACVRFWSNEETSRLENAVLSYRPEVPAHLHEPEQRKTFADFVRATRKDLLQAIGVDRLTQDSRELVVIEQRALGDRFDWSIKLGEGGFVGSPMDAAAMSKAKDRDILGIFREIPDKSNWDHPKHWSRGGNIQLSRAFAEFSRSNPERATRLVEHFEPHHQERAAGYALEAMADDAANDDRIVETLLDLHARGFRAREFTDSAARAIEKVAARRTDISEEVIGLLVEWLEENSKSAELGSGDGESESDSSAAEDRELRDRSLLWGYGGLSVLPGGNFNALSALAAILLSRKEAGRDRYVEILEHHFLRERDPKIWKALLYRLGNAGGSTPEVLSTFLRRLFARFPEILATQDAVVFLAHAQRWDDELVFDLIGDWRTSESGFLQQAYGELVGLVSTVKGTSNWMLARAEIMGSGSEQAKIGLAHAAVNLRTDEKYGLDANGILIALLAGSSKDVVATVMDVFRVTDELVPDASTVQLLGSLADPATDVSAAPSHFVVERLQALLPHEAELVARIAEKLVSAWRGELADMRTGTAVAAPQLTDLALTLHRLGGRSRQSGVNLFEAMIEIDAYGARDTLAEIDGRFGPHQDVARRRLGRRRKPRGRRRGSA
jgi:nucleoside phosphorylase